MSPLCRSQIKIDVVKWCYTTSILVVICFDAVIYDQVSLNQHIELGVSEND